MDRALWIIGLAIFWVAMIGPDVRRLAWTRSTPERQDRRTADGTGNPG